jgi:hypothetical protein
MNEETPSERSGGVLLLDQRCAGMGQGAAGYVMGIATNMNMI